ncbi:unnamed protein product [Symbiodinium sp. CCMP2592]|nr:unnamed protein product [Symbiodinium sp. CCMP2592]
MSCESLYRGMNYLEKQNPMATPTKDETCESNDPDRFLGLSPETAELWKTLGDTPDSKALKEEYLRTKGQLHRGFSSGSCGGSTTSETTQVLPGANMQYAKAVEEESRKRPPQDDALDVGLSKRMKQEQAALEKYMNEQMSKLRGQMQQELVQHQQALDEARKQHEAALQAEQERQEQLMMQRQAEHEATLQEEREQHEHNLCLLIEQASSAQAEAVRSMQTAPKPAKADTAPKPDANRADAHDAKAKLRAKMEAHTPGPQSAQPALQAPNPSQAIAVATTPQAAPAAQLALAVPVAKQLPPPAQTQLAVQPAGPPQGIGSGPFNSSTHPNAWGALYRITRAPDCLAEIKQAWDAGDFQRQNLLRDFIGRCYVQGGDPTTHKAKLNCLITFRTKTVKWRKNLQGYSWKTEAEMRKPPLEWEESRIQGAIKHCEKKKLTKKDLYDPNIRKYLVLVRDDVESAEEKLQELQQEMAQMGLLSSDFELGDIMEELDGETTTDNSKPQPGGKKRLAEYPTVEGEESIQEYLGQYRRAVLTRKALLKGARERLEKEGSKGHEEDLKVLSTSGDKLGCLLNELAKIEAGAEGGVKQSFAPLVEKIRSECIMFTSYHAQIKTHFAKTAAKTKAAPKKTPAPPDSEGAK